METNFEIHMLSFEDSQLNWGCGWDFETELEDTFENVKLEEKKPLWLNLPNELLINILRYLPHSDLQQIRLVCKRWHHVTQLPEFMEKSKLILYHDNMVSFYTCLIDDVELSNRLPYNTLELHDLVVSDELEWILKSLGPNIRELRLCKSPVFTILNDCLPELEELIVSDIMEETNFNKFSIDFSKFKNFKSLDISCRLATTYLISSLERNLPLKIEKFCFELIPEKEDFLIKTLQQYAIFLKHLEIMPRLRPSMLTEWKEVFASFRQLETLKIFGSYNDQWIKEVMECLPKETPLRNCALSGGCEVNDSLLQLIVHKWSRSLENVELKNCTSLTYVGVKELSMLRHNLKSLNISFCPNNSHLGLLHGLATEINNVLTTLTLDSIPGMDPSNMDRLIQHLPQLTYLSLRNCRKAVTNRTLKHIFRRQRKLQHLILDECLRITDKGILGFGLNPAPIHNLKSLQTLSLMGCTKLSNGALQGLKFNELRKLVLSNCYEITSMGIRNLVWNCSALEELKILNCIMIDNDAILYIAHGLHRLRCLDIRNCTRLTGKYIPSLVELCKSLKELSMSHINLLEIQDVKEKCLQLRPKTEQFGAFPNIQWWKK